MGKSTLAKRLAVEFSSLYSEHQFYVDYKGCAARYISEEDALITVIRTTYPHLKLPTNIAELRGLYESCFSGQKSLIVIENVGKPEQIKNLLPHSAKKMFGFGHFKKTIFNGNRRLGQLSADLIGGPPSRRRREIIFVN